MPHLAQVYCINVCVCWVQGPGFGWRVTQRYVIRDPAGKVTTVLGQRFSTKGDFATRPLPPGDIWKYLVIFLIVMTRVWGAAPGL